MRRVSLKEFRKVVKEAIASASSLYAEGEAGIGKSQVVHEVARELGKKVIDIRAILYDVGDLVVKYPDMQRKKLVELFSEILPTDEGYVIFLDEFRHAPQEVRRLFYQLILDRRLGASYKLPDDTAIIAVSNPSEEVETEELEAPLFDRFVYRVRVEPSFEEWQDYIAGKYKHSSVVLAYLQVFREDWRRKDEVGRWIVTPRRWEFALQRWESKDYILPYGIAERLKAFEKKMRMFSDVEAYVSGKKDASKYELQDQYALTSAIMSWAGEKPERILRVLESSEKMKIAEEIKAFLVFSMLKLINRKWGILEFANKYDPEMKVIGEVGKRYGYLGEGIV